MRLPHPTHARDSSLRRLSLANRWLVAGSVALTGVLTEVAAQAFPSSSKASASHPASSGKRHSDGAAKQTTTHKSLTPPAEAPEGASEPSPEAGSEPAPEATSEAAPEASAPSEAAPSEEATPSPEATPEAAPEAAPEAESSAPVISGGS
jgi:hypothetical protein